MYVKKSLKTRKKIMVVVKNGCPHCATMYLREATLGVASSFVHIW
jgi:hypothetical protein